MNEKYFFVLKVYRVIYADLSENITFMPKLLLFTAGVDQIDSSHWYIFSQSWIDKLMRCVCTVFYSFLVKQEIVGRVWPQRGIRQGTLCHLIYLSYVCGFSSIYLAMNLVREPEFHLHANLFHMSSLRMVVWSSSGLPEMIVRGSENASNSMRSVRTSYQLRKISSHFQ